MKRFLLLPTFAALWIALVLSCNKKLVSYNPDFIGEWRTEVINDTVIGEMVQSEIVIEKKDGLFNNTCKDVCEEHLCDCVSTHSGKPVISTDKKSMKIGTTGSYPLSIDKEPYQDASGQWIMKIQGLTYYKQ
jgi:hypothetical protein